VRFAEAGFDESPAARAVAEKYGTEHHVLDAPELDADTWRQRWPTSTSLWPIRPTSLRGHCRD
jgi:hypothetical protein